MQKIIYTQNIKYTRCCVKDNEIQFTSVSLQYVQHARITEDSDSTASSLPSERVQGQIQGHCAYTAYTSSLDTQRSHHTHALTHPEKKKNCLIKLLQHVGLPQQN